MPERHRPLSLEWLMLNGAIRYYPVVALLRSLGATSVLDVGCGDGGLGMYEPGRPFVGCDLQFGRPWPPMRAVVGRGGALPFADRSFDAVISLDTLEHVPPAERGAFVADLARVARRRLILAMPCGGLARLSERLLDRWYALLGISTPPFLDEHVAFQLPEQTEVEAVLTSLGHPFQVYGNENLLVHLLVMMGESLDWLRPRLIWLARERGEATAAVMARLNLRPTYRLIFVVDVGAGAPGLVARSRSLYHPS